MEFKVELEIPRSSSSNLAKVLKKARLFRGFVEPESRSLPFLLSVGRDEFRTRFTTFQEIYFAVRSWKGTELRLNGSVAGWTEINEILGVLRCAQGRATAVIEDKYCESEYYSHNWGCRHLTMVTEGRSGAPFHSRWESVPWYKFGSFDDTLSVWKVDREAVLRGIQREVDKKGLVLCPYLDMTAVESKVLALPAEIALDESADWEVEFAEEFHGNAVQKVAKGIRPKKEESSASLDRVLSMAFGLGQAPRDQPEDSAQERVVPEITFEDVGGVDSIIHLVREVIELPLVHAELLKHLGIRPHKGILLHGPPGCGKTLIAKAIANEINAHFISIRGPELFNKYIGQSEENLRRVFEEAEKCSPSIIFFDEIDAIGHSRSSEETAIYYSMFVNQLLTLLDGMKEYAGVCVVGSTNRKELLDPALLRPGRFDYILEVVQPTREGCRKILGIHSRSMPLDDSVNLDSLASRMEGMTGAEIAYVTRESAYNCLRRHANVDALIHTAPEHIELSAFRVSHGDFEKALADVISKGTHRS